MSKNITIYCKNTNSYHDFPMGTTLLEIADQLNIRVKHEIVAARANYKTEGLNFPIYKPKDIEFIDITCQSGMRLYVRTLSMVLAYATKRLFPKAVLSIVHAISKGYYCRIEHLGREVSEEDIELIKAEMKKIIATGEKIIEEEKQVKEVKKIFAKQYNGYESMSLFETINTPYMKYFRINNYVDYYNGALLPSTDRLHLFDLIPYYDGMLLRIPNKNNPTQLEEFEEMPKLFDIFKEHVKWNKIINVSTIGEFNVVCRNKKAFDLIKIAEALHEKKIARIADTIEKNASLKVILVSGPSSSGKTTFSKRLSVQLMASGLKPVMLSMDNYFVNRENTPVDENGEHDYEHLHALDLDFFNQQIRQLINQEEIDLPSFNFETGKREFRGRKLKLTKDSILIIEGIHALNPSLLSKIPRENIYKIYVSALTTIAIDSHNWIPTTDTRLLRRIIRDHRYRNYSARETIARWPSIRRGEDKWIFPYQEDADVMFNSALIFELAVLKKYAEPVLSEVPQYCDEYAEAYRLIKFLGFFAPIPDREIPPTSLLREFTGGSSFRY
ncbi:MAG: nucleoside kinase [Paludibacter sp.]|jgi:uridine kinase|nr:nucleoside kinase [Paludibacter sp.]HPM08848.1 nucleoside kinase [Paludibacter sp.]